MITTRNPLQKNLFGFAPIVTRAAAGCGGLQRAAAAGCGGLRRAAASTRKRPLFLVGFIKTSHLNNSPERSRRHEIPRVPPFSGSFSVSVHTKNHHVCCTGRDLKTAGPPDRHPNPRTTPSRHSSHGKNSCPLFVLLSRQAQLSASSSRCSPCVLVSSRRKARIRAPCDREVRSHRPHKHLRARP